MSFWNIPMAVWVCIPQTCLWRTISLSSPAESELGCLHVKPVSPKLLPRDTPKMVFWDRHLPVFFCLLLHLFKWQPFQSSCWGALSRALFFQRVEWIAHLLRLPVSLVLPWNFARDPAVAQRVGNPIKDLSWIGQWRGVHRACFSLGPFLFILWLKSFPSLIPLIRCPSVI
jgi:hypothetical protein